MEALTRKSQHVKAIVVGSAVALAMSLGAAPAQADVHAMGCIAEFVGSNRVKAYCTTFVWVQAIAYCDRNGEVKTKFGPRVRGGESWTGCESGWKRTGKGFKG